MSVEMSCQCCLLRPPDKDLKSSYSSLGQTEVYADMLKECFEIHINLSTANGGGICEVCIMRLRDSCEFKIQVQQCQKQLQAIASKQFKDETTTPVKEELTDAEDDIYFTELKQELSDFESSKDDDSIATMLGLNDGTVRKKVSKKRHAKPSTLLMDKSKKERKTKKLSRPIKLSLRSFSKLDIIKKPTIHIVSVSENNKHKVNLKNLLKNSNCTPFSNKTLSGIVCAFCKVTYQDLPTLRKHIAEYHKDHEIIGKKRMDKNNISIKMDITDLKCNVCNAKFDNITNLKKHLSSQHDVKFHPDVKDYILEFKLTDGEILNCALCNSTYETFKMLLQHMNGHYRNYICDVCDMGFVNKHRLKNHEKTHDTGNFECNFCDKIFTTRVRKVCHEKYTHNSNARYTTSCPHCDQSFTSYYQRNRHMSQEHNIAAATYKCNICDKSFILKSKLTSHIKKVHLMERNHICAECGQGFFIKQSLDEHMIKHNGERVFKCTVCHKAYARKKTLREHMRIHNNDRRFKCGVCGSAFVQKCSLKSHMLSNHGVTLSEYETTKVNTESP